MSDKSINEVLTEWRMGHRDRTGFGFSRSGYRGCFTPGCPTQIEMSQQRRHCYFHGGKPGRDPLWE